MRLRVKMVGWCGNSGKFERVGYLWYDFILEVIEEEDGYFGDVR